MSTTKNSPKKTEVCSVDNCKSDNDVQEATVAGNDTRLFCKTCRGVIFSG